MIDQHQYDSEAEECLISATFLDGDDTLARCIVGKVTADSFFVPANRVVFSCALSLYTRGISVDMRILAEELKTTRQLADVGGNAYLMQLSGKTPTTINVKYYIDAVRKKALLRKITAGAAAAMEAVKNYAGEDISEMVNPIEDFVQHIRAGENTENRIRGIGNFAIPDEVDPNTLLGDRYICRGHACLIVGGSGMGKSTIAYQASILWALGKPFLGIAVTNVKGWLSSVHFQSEDEDGDIAEVRESVYFMLQLTEEEKALVSERVVIITEKVLRGEAFISDMAVTARKLKSDLVWINPLHAFMKGDIKDAEAVGKFCREGLNAANRDSLWAYMIPHHTPKPAQATAGKDPKEKEWNEVMYEGAGSADLVNFCRSVQVLKATKNEGEFNIYLAKRGKKAGVRIEKESESGCLQLELVTKIPCRHCRKTMPLPGRSKEINVMYWEGRDADKPMLMIKGSGGARENAGRKADTNDGDFLSAFPHSDSEGEYCAACIRTASLQTGASKSTIGRTKLRCIEEGMLQPLPDGGIKRTRKGDICVEDYLSKRP